LRPHDDGIARLFRVRGVMLQHLLERILAASFLEFLTAFGTALTIFLGGIKIGKMVSSYTVRQRVARHAKDLQAEKDKSKHLETRFGEIQQLLDGSVNFWLSPTNKDLGAYVKRVAVSKPIITICNFKGGVAKTTLAANLAAYFDRHREMRVLLIDFDYQGSLTDLLLASAQLPNLEASAIKLIEGKDSVEKVLSKAVSLHPSLSRTKLFPCFYGFNKAENKVLLQWVTEQDQSEIRYRTHDYLSDPLIQEQFDVIIIDAPPRLMTGTINAALASTHILIPTILDGLSTTAALSTLGVFHELRKELAPGLQVLGIVPTFVSQAGQLNLREGIAMNELKQQLPQYWKSMPTPHIFEEAWICRREAVARVAGQNLAFETDDVIRAMFIKLGDQISERIFVNESARLPDLVATDGDKVTKLDAARRRA
jgi:cellulose biosynthesis protein BcsQ